MGRPTEGHSRDRSAWAVLNWPLVLVVIVYRWTLGHVLGGRCRFHPTCSAYAVEALRTHNPVRAMWLVVRRVGRCHPWGGSGVDPVPPWREEGHVDSTGVSTSADPEVSIDLPDQVYPMKRQI